MSSVLSVSAFALVTLALMFDIVDGQSAICYSNPYTTGYAIPAEDLENSSVAYGICKPGWYCPFLDPADESATWPRICPPSDGCQEARINNDFCDPQGPYEPTPCRGGNYCPNATQMLRCPEGHWCPLGCTEPNPCSPFAHCPSGTSNEYNMVGLLFLFLVDVTITLCVLLYRHLYRTSVQADQAELDKEEEMARVNTEVEEGRQNIWSSLTQGSSEKNLTPLFSLFKKAKGTGTSMTFRFNDLSVKIPASEVARISNSAASPVASPIRDQPASPKDTTSQQEDKTLLRGVNGRFRPGTVTAIMGPSGAGKTVLLNTLLNKNSSSWKQEGTLNVNHKLTISDIRHVVGFVPQDDVLHPELTVEQNLFYSSETRSPVAFSPEDRAELRSEILKVLGLSASRHVQIGDESSRGVSGGQRKRCSIGVELAACPTVLMLDEPTTGLDAATAMDLCNLLQRLSLGTNSTVVMVVHQPRVEIWNALDQVLLLAPGGRTVYQGPQSEAKAYFQGALGLNFDLGNPADIILDGIALEADLAVDMWDARMQLREAGNPTFEVASAPSSHTGGAENHPNAAPQEEAPTTGGAAVATSMSPEMDEETAIDLADAVAPPPRGAGFVKQVYLAAHRQLVKINTHIGASVMDVLLGTVCCIVMATAKIREEYVGIVDGTYALLAPKHKLYTLPMICMFYMLAVASGVAPGGIRTFGSSMTLYWREASNGHNKLAYFIGYSLIDLLRTLVGSLHFAVVAYLMAEPLQSFWLYWMWLAFLFIIVDSQSAALSMFLKPDTAPILATVVAIFVGLMNGYANIPVVGPASYAWWTTEAILHGEIWPIRNVWSVKVLSQMAPGDGWNLNQVPTDAAMLTMLYVVYRIIGFLLLVGLNREKQR